MIQCAKELLGAFAGVFALENCAPRESELLFPTEDYPLAFLLSDANGSALETLVGPFSLSSGRPDFSDPARLAVIDDGRLYLIAWSQEGLDEIRPPLDMSALLEARLVPHRFPLECSNGESQVSERIPRAVVPLTRGSKSYFVEAGGTELSALGAQPMAILESNLALQVVLAANWCGSQNATGLRPFGPSAFAIPDGGLIAGASYLREQFPEVFNLNSVVWLDSDRVVAASERFIFLLERDQSWSDAPGRALDLGRLGFVGCAMASAPEPIGADHQLFLACSRRVMETPAGGVILVLDVEGSSVSFNRTATVSDQGLTDLAVRPDGRVSAVGYAGRLITAPSIFGPFLSFQLGSEGLVRIVETGDTELPTLIAGNASAFYAGDARTGSFRRVMVPADQEMQNQAIDGLGAARIQGELRVFAADVTGALHIADASRVLETRKLALPPAGRLCGRPEVCGNHVHHDQFEDLMIDARNSAAPEIYLLGQTCNAAFQHRVAENCTTMVAESLLTVGREHSLQLDHFARRGDRLILCGKSALLYELELP